MAAPVYSHRLVGVEGHTGWGAWVNDTGETAVIRDVCIVSDTTQVQTVQCSIQGNGFFLKRGVGVAPGDDSIHLDCRVVVNPGEELLYFSQLPTSFVISGYLLSAS